MNRFPLPRCASAIQIVCPLESIAETQLQLQPALLRLSLTLGIVDHARRRFTHFKLGAHLLDLRCLLFHGCCWALVVSPLCHGYVAKLSKAIKERIARNSESEVNSDRSVSFGQAGSARLRQFRNLCSPLFPAFKPLPKVFLKPVGYLSFSSAADLDHHVLPRPIRDVGSAGRRESVAGARCSRRAFVP
jgi:hypothetical protein